MEESKDEPRHVTSATTDSTDDTGSPVLLFGTVVLSMSDSTAILTNLILVVSKRSVERGEFSKLTSLVIVLSFRYRRSLFKDES